jgi:hypothetical protein
MVPKLKMVLTVGSSWANAESASAKILSTARTSAVDLQPTGERLLRALSRIDGNFFILPPVRKRISLVVESRVWWMAG